VHEPDLAIAEYTIAAPSQHAGRVRRARLARLGLELECTAQALEEEDVIAAVAMEDVHFEGPWGTKASITRAERVD